MSIKNTFLKQIYAYIVVICIIFGSGDTWISFHNVMCMYGSMGLVIMLLGIAMLKKGSVNVRCMKIVAFMCFLVAMSMITNLDFSGYSMFVVLLIALLVEENFCFDEFYKCFENVIFLLTLISLATMCLWVINPDSVSDILQIVYIKGNNASVPWRYRLYGIFREPAMYCIYLGLAVTRNLFFYVKLPKIRVIAYLSALLFTASMTGWVAVSFVLLFYIWTNYKNWYFKLIFVCFIGALIIGMSLSHYDLIGYALERLSMKGASAYSSNSRYYSIIGGAIVGMTHPWFGTGAVKSGDMFQQTLENLIGKGYCWANMITYLWASFGSIFIYIFLRGIYDVMDERKRSVAISFFIMVCLLLCGEMMTYSSVMYIFMLYGHCRRPLGRIRRRGFS